MTTVSLQELTLFLFFLWLFKREGPRNAFGPPAVVTLFGGLKIELWTVGESNPRPRNANAVHYRCANGPANAAYLRESFGR